MRKMGGIKLHNKKREYKASETTFDPRRAFKHGPAPRLSAPKLKTNSAAYFLVIMKSSELPSLFLRDPSNDGLD